MIGKRIGGRYLILSLIGTGGMGSVYLGKDELLGRNIALKMITTSVPTEGLRQRFEHEARALAMMEHPAIVVIYDIGDHEGTLFFTMPVIQGKTLKALLAQAPLRLSNTLEIGAQVADALAYTHARNVVHRDIKPDNIMIERDDSGQPRVRITDFGIASSSGDSSRSVTRTGEVVGTIAYMSPEQLSGTTADHRMDIYSLGTVLYECLAGETPFAGDIYSALYRIVHEPPRRLGSIVSGLDPQLEELIMRCLEKDPQLRPQQASELAMLLRGCISRLSGQKELELAPTMVLKAPARREPEKFLLVGRDAELSLIKTHISAVIGGELRLLLISGETGIGKSRMLDAIEDLTNNQGIRTLRGRFSDLDQSFPYQGFYEMIESYLRDAAMSHSSFSNEFGDLEDDLFALFPSLPEVFQNAERISILPSPPQQQRPPDALYIFDVLARTMARIAQNKALALIFDDLHVAHASIDALQYIARRLATSPLLIAGAYTSTEVDRAHPLSRLHESFQRNSRFVTIPLKALSVSDHRVLVEALAPQMVFDSDTLAQLYAVTDGNPLFTQELVRSFLDQGSNLKTTLELSERWSSPSLGLMSLPATIQKTVEKRIGRLSESQREILDMASALGKNFEARYLEALSSRDDLDEQLERLIEEGFLTEERRDRGDWLAFTSSAIREVLYASLSKRRKRTLHRKAAEAIEQLNATRPEKVHSQLVYHYALADTRDKVYRYGLPLMRTALATSSPDDVIRYSAMILGFLEDEDTSMPALEGETYQLKALAYRMMGERGNALRAFEQAYNAYECARDPSRQLQAVVWSAKISWDMQRAGDTKRWLDRGLAMAREMGERETLSELLTLGIAVANVQGENQSARAYIAELDEQRRNASEDTGSMLAPGGTLNIPLLTSLGTLDPLKMEFILDQEVLCNVFETLVKTDETGHLIPGLCEHWSMENEGGCCHLRLRAGILLHDGRTLNAAHLKAWIEHALRSEAGLSLPPAFTYVDGAMEFARQESSHISGIELLNERELRLNLKTALPNYPAFLTDSRAAVALDEGAGARAPIGTGPFIVEEYTAQHIVLKRFEAYSKGGPAFLDRIVYHFNISPEQVTQGLQSGRFDLARQTSAKELNELLHQRRAKYQMSEVSSPGTMFILFNTRQGPCAVESFRQALCGAVNVRDLVTHAFGRFAHPATNSIIPPGILGHDSARVSKSLPDDEIVERFNRSNLNRPLTLRFAMSPSLAAKYRPLVDALIAIWALWGINAEYVTPDIESYLYCRAHGSADILFDGWSVDYQDPDNFSYSLFHSMEGQCRAFVASPHLDRLVERGRIEPLPEKRVQLYRAAEDLLLKSSSVLPLFYDIQVWVASRRVKNLRVMPHPHYVDLRRLGIEPGAKEVPMPHRTETARSGGILSIPLTVPISSCDPAGIEIFEHMCAIPLIFETLMEEVAGGRVVPNLAEEIHREEGARRFRIRLRDQIRFHDGRKLDAWDVKFSLERLLRHPGPGAAFLVIRGAQAFLRGEQGDVSGIQIQSSGELSIELERPVFFFPAMLAHSCAAIVPEGIQRFDTHFRNGCVGTGAFRIRHFEPGRRLELEANPAYWKRGFPKADGIVFSLAIPKRDQAARLRAAQYSMLLHVPDHLVDELRRDPAWKGSFYETGSLNTSALFFNTQRGVCADIEFRRMLLQNLPIASIVREATGRSVLMARTFIPPVFLGDEDDMWTPPSRVGAALMRLDVEMRIITTSSHEAFVGPLTRELAKLGIRTRFEIGVLTMELINSDAWDLCLGNWASDYPDPDSFVYGALHSETGAFGGLCGQHELDKLLEGARLEANSAHRQLLYREIESYISEQALLIPLHHPAWNIVIRPEVQGMREMQTMTNMSVDFRSLWIKR